MVAGLLLFVSVCAAEAEPSADESLKLEVRRCVRQLDSPQLAEREAAEAALLKLGPKILPLLPPTNDRTPAEVKLRLGRIQQQLQQAAAEAAAKPTLITLRGDGLPLDKVLAALAEQSGNKIVDFRERFGQQAANPALKVNFQQTPFWQALDEVLDQAALTVYPFGQERAIHVVARGEGHLPRSGRACYSGPFRIEPVLVTAQRRLRDPAGESLRLTIEVAWEPRLKPISLKQPLGSVKATDEGGRPLPVENEEAELEAPVREGATAVELVLLLKLPPREVKEIARLQGSLTAMIPGKVETFSFEDLVNAKQVEKRIAGATVTLDRVQENNKLWQVLMRVRFDQPGEALQSHRGWILQNEAFLEGPDDKPIAFLVSEMTRQAPNEVGMSYGFRLGGPPAKHKFVYRTPGAVVAAGFNYELRGIRLP